ncbi:hypothetical protein WKR88_14580 [Trinickia caryophylli]|uniref:N-acetyltransferase domain-containing protein n=1 Tax=Trinickia caryophylli TaxID=28094 RepID=A0A1X7GHL6_TRICW|nr:hypothetical protein [Trinickia caryophylli]WQE14737.1 hypothetical protein U0034_19425 [Trinickia caryophylli]GLU34933.1 hypothetical protein Busp01_47750 [Trinickia caryophylli]SMF70022.1 hypothetical protein SAMN06295900_11617 [Trinickia caryophylli]
MQAEPDVERAAPPHPVQHQQGAVHPIDGRDARTVEQIAACWNAGRQMSAQLAVLLYGGHESMFRALATPDYLLAGAAMYDDTGEPLAWMALVRHHERAGYAGTARLVFDLDTRAPDGTLERLLHACRSSLCMQGIRVVIGFSDDASPALSRGYAALGFRRTGELRLGAHGSGRVVVHALELHHDH